jgi:hypothetical protein
MEVQQENSPKERGRPSTPTAVDLLQIEGAHRGVWLLLGGPAVRGRILGQCLGVGLPKTDRALSIHPESRSSRLASNL